MCSSVPVCVSVSVCSCFGFHFTSVVYAGRIHPIGLRRAMVSIAELVHRFGCERTSGVAGNKRREWKAGRLEVRVEGEQEKSKEGMYRGK